MKLTDPQRKGLRRDAMKDMTTRVFQLGGDMEDCARVAHIMAMDAHATISYLAGMTMEQARRQLVADIEVNYELLWAMVINTGKAKGN